MLIFEDKKENSIWKTTRFQNTNNVTTGVNWAINISHEFDLFLGQPMFGPFQVGSTMYELATAALATVLAAGKHT